MGGVNGYLWLQLANAYFILMIALFIIWLEAGSKKNQIFKGLFCLPLIGLALLHIFIEVQPRYHIPFMPFTYFGAASLLATARNKIKLQPISAEQSQLVRNCNPPKNRSSFK